MYSPEIFNWNINQCYQMCQTHFYESPKIKCPENKHNFLFKKIPLPIIQTKWYSFDAKYNLLSNGGIIDDFNAIFVKLFRINRNTKSVDNSVLNIFGTMILIITWPGYWQCSSHVISNVCSSSSLVTS